MSRATLRILAAGTGVTIQDGGRRGYLRFGVTESGPMDRFSHAIANRAAGVALDSAAIEVSLGGIEFVVEGQPVSFSIAGGSFDIRLGEQTLPRACIASVQPGHKLAVRAGPAGEWCYVAVCGRFDLQATLGSVSMHTRSSIGGNGLRAGDQIQVLPSEGPLLNNSEIVAPWFDAQESKIRVILGPQHDYFDPTQVAAFLNATWVVSNRSDRMGYILEGPPIKHAGGFNIVSDGTAAGSIQILGNGRPIVLMADRPPTGGYPKVATVIGADLGHLAQLRPGQSFQFQLCSMEEAVAARRHQAELLEPATALRPVTAPLATDTLLRKNLVDGVISGVDEAD